MQVREAMTTDVRTLDPDQTLQEAARLMAECDVGSLPIDEGGRLIGMVTDRDITIRAVAQGKSPDTHVRDIMTKDVKYCFEDEDIAHVARNMGDIQVHRLDLRPYGWPACVIAKTRSGSAPLLSHHAASASASL